MPLDSPPPAAEDPWSSHAAPTVADIALAPRRPLRDGSDSVSSVSSSRRGRGRGSKSRSRTPAPVLGKRSRTDTEADTDRARTSTSLTPEGPDAEAARLGREEASRRLPRLHARRKSQPAEVWDGEDEDEDENENEDADVVAENGGEGLVNGHGTPAPQGDGPSLLENSGAGALGSGSGSAPAAAHDMPTAPTRRPGTSPSPALTCGPRRFTAAEKGKGRAVPSPTPEISDDDDAADADSDIVDLGLGPMDESIQFIASAPPSEPEPRASKVIDEESALSGFTCPVCFSAPTNPAFTPCGHVLCYSCLHASLLSAIQRQINPYPNAPQRGGRRGRGPARRRGRGRRGAPSILESQPAMWDDDTLHAAVDADRAEVYPMPGGRPPEDDDVKIDHLLNGLWKLDDKYVIEGECPVCREPIAGGLGPLGSGIGGVTVIETRVALSP